MGGDNGRSRQLFDGPCLSPQAEVGRAMALLPFCGDTTRARCVQRLTSCIRSADVSGTTVNDGRTVEDDVLCRSGVVLAAAYLSRAALRLAEGRQLLDVLCAKASYSSVLRDELRKAFSRDRSLQIELACESSMSPAQRLMQAVTAKGRPAKRSELTSLESELLIHPDLLIRKLLDTDDGGTTLRYTAAEVDALFFQASEQDTEVLHDIWKWPQSKGAAEVRLTDEDYYISANRPSIATRIADVTALDPFAAKRISSEPGGLRALRVLADSVPAAEKRVDLFDTEVARCMANVFAQSQNIAVTATRAADEGLVSRLSRWCHQTQSAARGHLQVEAYRALCNLSQALEPDITKRRFYMNGILPLQAPHVCSNNNSNIDTDVVLVHGLRGGPLLTWRCGHSAKSSTKRKPSTRSFFRSKLSTTGIVDPAYEAVDENISADSSTLVSEAPVSGESEVMEVWARDWLSADAPNCRILSVGHDAGVLRRGWGRGMIGPSLSERAADVCIALRTAGVGEGGRKVVFVTHSYGGLLVKDALSQDQNLWASTSGIVFFGVPHFGSPAPASLPGQTRFVLSKAVRELFPASDPDAALSQLNESFCQAVTARLNERESCNEGDVVRVVSFGEDRPLQMGGGRGRGQIRLNLVPPDSANPGVGLFTVMPDTDHIRKSKPPQRDDIRYQAVLALVRGDSDLEAKMQK